ncbi:MAG: fatty acid desaturase [Archangium sp.]|nr:fatty acid desaturase [Archangium sp.]MDP3153961.1 fatty acid desaturase [Archangium sp.]MDP3574236.1 fatty acid desaturase [Archangium sp.]
MSARLQVEALLGHAVRHAIAIVLLIAGAHHAPVALAGALVLHLAAFAFTHELAHGALGLPRRLNELALSLAALPMLVAGHGMRALHLRHHARPLAADDLEGVGATMTLWRAVLAGPMNAAQYRTEAFRAGDNRAWLIAETMAAIALTVLALISRTTLGAAWVLVNVVLQLTASAWASNLPHRPPAHFVKIARHLEWTRSAVVASFLHHELHHRFPSLPLPAWESIGWMSRRNQENPA